MKVLTKSIIPKMEYAAPRALAKSARFGEAVPMENAPIRILKKTYTGEKDNTNEYTILFLIE